MEGGRGSLQRAGGAGQLPRDGGGAFTPLGPPSSAGGTVIFLNNISDETPGELHVYYIIRRIIHNCIRSIPTGLLYTYLGTPTS